METPFLERQSRFPLSNRSVTVKYALVHMCYWILVPGRVTSPDPDIFVAATPCDAVPRAMLGIPANLDCEMIKWRLTLRRDPRNPGRDDFQLQYTYGMTRPGTQGFKDDGFTKELSGKWTTDMAVGHNCEKLKWALLSITTGRRKADDLSMGRLAIPRQAHIRSRSGGIFGRR